VLLALTGAAAALSPGTDLLVPAAARIGPWVTDLYLLNLDEGAVDVTVQWLVRDQPNPEPAELAVELAAGESRKLADVVGSGFGLVRGTGALRIIASGRVVANCRIFARVGEATLGQGFEGVPRAAATAAGGRSQAVGLELSSRFRSNVYALAGEDGAVFTASLLDPAGSEIASTTLSLGTWEPMLRPVAGLFGVAALDDGTLEVEVAAGSVLVGASRIDELSSDPTTLAGWVDGRFGGPLADGTHFGVVLRQDSATTGGIALAIEGREVAALEFSFPSGRCPVLFSAGQDLGAGPVPIADFATGYEFSSSYPEAGSVVWTLQLEAAGQALVGSLSAVATGWSGELASCNGEHGPHAVRIGEQSTN
jgi:hypothetical protein